MKLSHRLFLVAAFLFVVAIISLWLSHVVDVNYERNRKAGAKARHLMDLMNIKHGMKITCPHCREEVKAGATFCYHCRRSMIE